MRRRITLVASIVAVGLVAIGCGNGETADTSPLPSKDTQARVDEASKNVENSAMTPEQKQAAADYLKQGAANAERMKSSAVGTTAGAPK